MATGGGLLVMLMLMLLLAAGAFALLRLRESRVTRTSPNPLIYVIAFLPFLGFFLLLEGSPAPWAKVIFLLAMAACFGFLALWVREIVSLMGLSDEAFPGRHDKALWLALLAFLPPVGLVAFSIFRRAYWPIEKPAKNVSAHELM